MNIDESEEARAAGQRACEEWRPTFDNWAQHRLHDVELLTDAAFMDGFRQALRQVNRVDMGTVELLLLGVRSGPRVQRVGTMSRAEKLRRLKALEMADIGQDLGSR